MSFCQNCGSQLDDQTNFCPKCGAGKVATPPPPPVQQYGYQPAPQYIKPRIPGRGLGIASMVLGIIGLVYAVGLLGNIASTLNSWYSRIADEMIPVVAVFSILAILSIAFSGSAKGKGYRTGVSTSGMVMGIISALIYAVCIILIATS